MEQTLNGRIEELEQEIKLLTSKLEDISNNVEEKAITPYSKSGGIKDHSQQRAIDISTGLSQALAGSIIWNDVELTFPPYGTKPSDSTKGYNRHSHSRFSGGALDINTLEIIEYDIDWEENITFNKDCQSLWKTYPKIKKMQNSKQENVEKIGLLDLIFNADTQKWGTTAYEIDIKKCYFVERDEDGNIALDSKGQEKRSLLQNESNSKTNIIWDKSSQVWRFFAVYSE